MKFIAAYLLAQLSVACEEGDPIPPPGKADVRRILESVGAEVQEDRLDMLFAELEGKDFAELIAAGRERLAYAPCAGTGMAGVASAAPAGPGSAGEGKEEEKKEEEKVEEEEDDLVFSLFDEE